MATQYIETPAGDRLVIIPEAEYKILRQMNEAMEDAADSAAARDMLEKIKSGEEELIPGEIVKRLSRGVEHPLRIWRDYRGMKAKDLAAAANITAVYLSEIEHGKKPGGLVLFRKFARTLDVSLDDLVPDDMD